jgi:hypothetical protein
VKDQSRVITTSFWRVAAIHDQDRQREVCEKGREERRIRYWRSTHSLLRSDLPHLFHIKWSYYSQPLQIMPCGGETVEQQGMRSRACIDTTPHVSRRSKTSGAKQEHRLRINWNRDDELLKPGAVFLHEGGTSKNQRKENERETWT